MASSKTSDREGRPEYIVGIGASAGGLESLQRMFDRLPSGLGMSYIVVQHLSPDFKSMMDELLGKHTDLPVLTVEDGMQVEKDRVYLIPPGKDMIISEGYLRLSDRDPDDKLTLPIDTFLRSMAADFGSRAIGIILSGTGSDGARGVVAVAEAGGLVLAESEESAKFSGMPRSAEQTGCVDRVLGASDIGDALRRYAEVPKVSEELLEGLKGGDDDLEALLGLLKDHSGLNFGCYKSATVARRINRRILLHHNQDLAQYVRQVRDDPEELDALYRDLLIGVTRFFRDEQAFQEIAKVLDQRLEDLKPGEDLRIWSAGCASGEEIYSLVILANEAFRRKGRPPAVKAFATDVHELALRVAGQGRYPEQALESVPDELKARYFELSGDEYVVNQELRSQIVFARHDMLRDAPFTRLDLVSCRNLLIYFTPEAQKKAVTVCHFGLKPSGILFLGPSETPGNLSDEFKSLDNRWKIFQKRRDIRLLPSAEVLPFVPTTSERPKQERRPESARQAETFILDRYAPPSLVVSQDFKLIHTFAGASKFLKHKDGEVSLNILDLLDGDLRFAVSATLQRAKKTRELSIFRGVRVEDDVLDLEISPLFPDLEAGTPLVIALRPAGPPERTDESRDIDVSDLAAERIEDLEEELAQTKENLQTALEEMEASNEELQATNEELMASNEELQGTNQELHSVNEELYSVNAEYQNKIEELREVTADLNQLLDTAQVHTLFLDQELRITRFTDGMGRLFGLVSQDHGRKLQTFSHGLSEADLIPKLHEVMDSGDPKESLVESREGRVYLMRLIPYRRGDETTGVVLTLLDVTDLHSAQAARSRQARIINATSDFIATTDSEGKLQELNPGGREMLGLDEDAELPRSIFDCHPEWAAEVVRLSGIPSALEEGRWSGRTALNGPDGEIPVSQVILAHRGDDGEIEYLSTVMRDLSEVTAMMRSLQEADERKNEFIAMLGHELRNPLQAIQVSLDLLGNPEARHVDHAHRVISHQTSQLSRLVDDLLDVSRVTRGKIQLRPEPLELGQLLSQMLGDAETWNGGRHALRLNVPETDEIWVHGDSARIEQIVGNLVANAMKYSQPGTTVSVTLSASDEDAQITVEDEGVGLSEEEIRVIFDPFVQVDKTSGSGLGLGLTLVSHLTDLHAGEVRVSSDGQGKGSRFSVCLPRIDAPDDADRERSDRHDPTFESARRVLVVDDNREALGTLTKLLQMRGCEVFSADHGKQAVKLALAKKPDAAVIDIGLPDMTGHQVAEMIRAQVDQPIRLVAATGYGQEAVRKQALSSGFDTFLVKPVSLRELEKALEGDLCKADRRSETRDSETEATGTETEDAEAEE